MFSTLWHFRNSGPEAGRAGDTTCLPSPLRPASMLYDTLIPSMVQRRISKFQVREDLAPPGEVQNFRQESTNPDTRHICSPAPPNGSSPEAQHTHPEQTTTVSEPPAPSTSRPPSAADATSGVNWRYADPGLCMLSLSQSEAAARSSSPHFVRRHYIDGVACALRGLPTDLTAEEERSLREVVPAALRTDSTADARTRPGAGVRTRSTLHRWVAAATLSVVLLASLLLPYLRLLAREAYAFDRRHRVSDRVMARAVLAADRVGKRTVTLAARLYAVRDGQWAESMRDVGGYVVQGVGGGVCEGLGEGVQVLGLRGVDVKGMWV